MRCSCSVEPCDVVASRRGATINALLGSRCAQRNSCSLDGNNHTVHFVISHSDNFRWHRGLLGRLHSRSYTGCELQSDSYKASPSLGGLRLRTSISIAVTLSVEPSRNAMSTSFSQACCRPMHHHISRCTPTTNVAPDHTHPSCELQLVQILADQCYCFLGLNYLHVHQQCAGKSHAQCTTTARACHAHPTVHHTP